MKVARGIAIVWIASLASMFLVVAMNPVRGESLLLDDFSNPSLAGWSNVETYSEKPWGPGTIEVVDGELFYGTAGSVPPGTENNLLVTGFALSEWSASSDSLFENGFLRAKVRAESVGEATEVGNIAMFVRGDITTLTAYVAGAIGSNKSFVLDKFVNGAVAQEWIIDGENLTLNEDWFMELGAVGSEISMKVWKASEPEPSMAQLSVTDTEMISSGTVGLTAAMTPASATEPLMLSTYYDDVTFTVPEPATLSLALLASLAVLAFSRQRR